MFPKGFKYGNQNACQEYLKISKMSHLRRTNFKERENVSEKQQLQTDTGGTCEYGSGTLTRSHIRTSC